MGIAQSKTVWATHVEKRRYGNSVFTFDSDNIITLPMAIASPPKNIWLLKCPISHLTATTLQTYLNNHIPEKGATSNPQKDDLIIYCSMGETPAVEAVGRIIQSRPDRNRAVRTWNFVSEDEFLIHSVTLDAVRRISPELRKLSVLKRRSWGVLHHLHKLCAEQILLYLA